MERALFHAGNIGERGRLLRRRAGLAALAFSGAWLLAAISAGAPLPPRLWAALPGMAGTLTLLEANRSTCVFLALRGVRRGSDGAFQKLDRPSIRYFRQEALVLLGWTLLAGLGAAALASVSFQLR